jgi:Homeodomain
MEGAVQSMSLPIEALHAARDHQKNYSFLVQYISRDTTEQDDSSLSNRQKRRRTSPQDHALLEAAYQRNSKPDKNERLELVSQVALDEKEVQVTACPMYHPRLPSG